MKHRTLWPGLLAAAALLAIAPSATAWEFDGGAAWAKRVGPGVHGIIGGNTCTDDFCDHAFDTHFGGSFAGTGGFFYRVIPNLVLLGELHLGYINTDRHDLDDDRGLLFQATFAAELHVPATGWLDPYLGFGIGYAYLGFWADGPHDYNWTHAPFGIPGPSSNGHDYHVGLHGMNFEWRTGVDVYPFSRIPNFGMGPQFRLGMTYWPTVCVESGSYDDCSDPDDWDNDDMPFLFFFGGAAKLGF